MTSDMEAYVEWCGGLTSEIVIEDYTDWCGAMDQPICPDTADVYLFTEHGSSLPDWGTGDIVDYADDAS